MDNIVARVNFICYCIYFYSDCFDPNLDNADHVFSIAWIVFIAEKYDETVFLHDQKKKHEFLIANGVIYKNGKERKDIRKMSLYKYKKYLLIVFNRGEFYLIPNNAFIEGSRSEFLTSIQFTGFRSFKFKI